MPSSSTVGVSISLPSKKNACKVSFSCLSSNPFYFPPYFTLINDHRRVVTSSKTNINECCSNQCSSFSLAGAPSQRLPCNSCKRQSHVITWKQIKTMWLTNFFIFFLYRIFHGKTLPSHCTLQTYATNRQSDTANLFSKGLMMTM